MAPLRVLVFSSLFPNAALPLSAPYLLRQTTALARLCHVSVVAPQPWFPGRRLLQRFTYWKRDLSTVPDHDQIEGLPVAHPRILRLPRMPWLAASSYFVSLLPRLADLRGKADVILATWAYPDGVAAVQLGRRLRIPVVLQVIGSDLNVVAQLPGVRAQLSRALTRVDGAVAVSRPLAERLIELGAPSDRVQIVATGLERALFHPRDRSEARRALGQSPEVPLLLFVGRLSEAKGVPELLVAFRRLSAEHPECRLALVGDGPLRAECEREAASFAGKLIVAGELPPARVAEWVAACTVLTLPSHMEGTPNVILEALGSGRKVVATSVGGIPDLIRDPRQGERVPVRDAEALQAALWRVASSAYDPDEVASSSGIFDWDENARRVLALLQEAVLRKK